VRGDALFGGILLSSKPERGELVPVLAPRGLTCVLARGELLLVFVHVGLEAM
jgi:hypothetical protein